MTDKLTPEQRHTCMAHIRAVDTKPEMLVRKYLFAHGFRYRLHVKSLPGKPDIVLKKYRTVIMVNGCFWHGHEGCRNYRLPKTNTSFWREKIECNRSRDDKEAVVLRLLGWHVIRIWECELAPKRRKATLLNLEITLNHLLIKNYAPASEAEGAQAAEPPVAYGNKTTRGDKARD